MERSRVCCFTGHREIPEGIAPFLRAQIRAQVQQLNREGYDTFLCGGALGFDTLAAETVLEEKQAGLPVRLALALPCRDQHLRWSRQNQQRYLSILAAADEAVFLNEQYCPGCMQQRNRYLVEHSSRCIAYCVRDSGGTAYTVNHCRRKHVPVLLLRPCPPREQRR